MRPSHLLLQSLLAATAADIPNPLSYPHARGSPGPVTNVYYIGTSVQSCTVFGLKYAPPCSLTAAAWAQKAELALSPHKETGAHIA